MGLHHVASTDRATYELIPSALTRVKNTGTYVRNFYEMSYSHPVSREETSKRDALTNQKSIRGSA